MMAYKKVLTSKEKETKIEFRENESQRAPELELVFKKGHDSGRRNPPEASA